LNSPDELHIRDPHDHQGVSGKIIITCGNKIVHNPTDAGLLWDCQELDKLNTEESSFHFLGHYNNQQVFSLELTADKFAVLSTETSGLRLLLGTIPDGLFRLLGRALQINDWSNAHGFCGYCGSKTNLVPNERAMGCGSCHKVYYPRLSPCVMALVTRGEECLLARNLQWNVPRFSVLAGFIEPGESAEDALHREVMEEVGIQVGQLEYINSQPWPFPGQLMLGFFAGYDSGLIRADGVEIAEAHWYHYTNLPTIPGEYSLSGQLIRKFVERCSEG